MSESYDIIVIGGGTGGYPAAIRAGQMGMKVACINAWLNRDGKPAYGGTCLNAGCIPSKALLESSEMVHRAQHELKLHGIETGKVSFDLATMQARKNKISSGLTGGIGGLFKANGVTGLEGWAKLLGDGKVEFTSHAGESKTLTAKHIIVATGSEPVELKKVAPFDHEVIVDSWDALDFTAVPKRLGIIGAGVIGVELGSVWARLGAETVILEALDVFLPMVDAAIAKDAQRQFTKQGLDIRLGAKVSSTKVTGKGKSRKVEVSYEQGGKTHTETFDTLIVAVGRRPFTDRLGADEVGLALDERGFIKVDAHYRTSLPGVYATGDVIGGAMLAHKAIEEGVALVEQLAGHHTQVNYKAVPSVIYTTPEIAWVGLTEAQAKEQGFEVKTGATPFAANGRAKALEAANGSIKVIADAKTDRILGVHMCGPYVSELLAEAVLGLEFAATCEDIALTMHAHPTLSENFHEAVLSVDGRAIHALNKKKAA
ncbi:dihydrolipoyl dehydrogenase [Flagellatimonas centrodinii]|uniref:dihydrolipoyl dehydrogenase n=1 Tax=Flagellatimonas centrodinii TaxID=2806210 RepID=UPI001FFD608D|nr:dihydrolipoyl dehydrogenase [Flagellatimonas centrodinii]ULQ46483.1 dihydrolipoyl dehydrogenase [Flagellatimonas centrodinii]